MWRKKREKDDLPSSITKSKGETTWAGTQSQESFFANDHRSSPSCRRKTHRYSCDSYREIVLLLLPFQLLMIFEMITFSFPFRPCNKHSIFVQRNATYVATTTCNTSCSRSQWTVCFSDGEWSLAVNVGIAFASNCKFINLISFFISTSRKSTENRNIYTHTWYTCFGGGNARIEELE